MPYTPAHDAVEDPEVIAGFVRRHPLATLITHDGTAPDADLIPLLLQAGDDGAELIGHVARSNPLWRPSRQQGPALAVFGPAEHYISPTWYPSKAEHHRVVPTWNYLVVHAWGQLIVHDDPRWVRGAVARLTNAMEAGREEPWRMAQAPADFTEQMLQNIVGISIRVERITGKFKVSSHRTDADRLGARDGVAAEADGLGFAEVVAAMTDPPDQGFAGRRRTADVQSQTEPTRPRSSV
jgi:transcriptional regulator